MATSRFSTVNQIVNAVAVQVGLTPVADVFSTDDPVFAQMISLLTSGLQTLMEDYEWNNLVREYQLTTVAGDTGKYALPTDFAYMIDQTGWERSENVPLLGPVSAQEWTCLLGRDLVSSTIYASFRFDQNEFYIFPNNPVTPDLNINFEYISRNLIQIAAAPTTYTDEATVGADVVMFPPNLVRQQLKMMFLTAKGFDSSAAAQDFQKSIDGWMGRDKSAGILSASGGRGKGYLLNGFRNTPDTGYGT